MSYRTPAQISAFLDRVQFKMDVPQQFYGDEPNSYGERAGGSKKWENASLRTCIFACWAYEQAAGNQAIPLVYKTINEYREDFLCDRSYFASTPRDLRMFESEGIPIFGVEHRHQLADYDVIGTSISYPVLTINFVKQLMMSDIPPTWADRIDHSSGRVIPGRHRKPEAWPFVIVGGQLFGAPEVAANIVDAVFCGEAEDEEGNPGIGLMLERIAEFKELGVWQSERLACYAELAKEFDFLYFPCFVDVQYGYEERESVAEAVFDGSEVKPSKQVFGYTSNLPGMRLPVKKRFVKNMDSVAGLTNPPLLYNDPGMGAADVEAGRGCPAWCVSGNERLFVEGEGLVRLDEWAGAHVHPGELGLEPEHTAPSMRVAQRGAFKDATCVVSNGKRRVLRIRTQQGFSIEVTPDHEVEIHTRRSGKLSRGSFEWRRADEVQVGDVFPVNYGQGAEGPYRQVGGRKVDETSAWMLGLFVGDGGWAAHGSIPFFTMLEGNGIEEKVARYMAEEWGWQPAVQRPATDPRVLIYRYSCQAFREWLTQLGFAPGKATAESKLHVPEVIFRSPLSVQRAFLQGLFEADGDVDVKGYYLQLTTVSERLAREAGLLLLNLGHRAMWQKRRTHSATSLAAKAGSTLQDVFLLRVRPTPGADTSWMEFLSSRKAELISTFRERTLDEANNLNGWTLSKRSIPAKVVAVEEVEQEVEVFDLAVPDGHAFDASGFTVHNCGFCALTYRQKPYRQRSVEKMTEMSGEVVRNTGVLHIAPFSPDFPMHTEKKRLISSILEKVSDDVDASSMRVDDFIADPSYILLQAHGGMDSVTLGVEGNSQRMRDLVGKGAADEDVKEAVARGIRAGIRKFKLYMIASLPGEDDGDIYKILNLAKELADIRDSLGSSAIIQFSWTPMLIEGNTPFQWFSPTASNFALGDVWEEFRNLKIGFQLGGKAQKDKLGYFQLTQRASREVGMAMVEAVAEMNAGCWGGAPRGMYEMVEERLKARGFHNAYADCYDERAKHDMFGWEQIDQGINVELMWVTYQQMKEFLEQTDSETYDLNFNDDYHGSEWIERCDTKCYGKTCGVCDVDDLKIRRNYIQAAADEIEVDLSNVKVIDQKTVAMKVRAKIVKDPSKRFVMNDHFRYAFRRAANLAGLPHAKRSWKFSSDDMKFKDWTCGADFVEFGTTKRLSKSQLAPLIEKMNESLAQGSAVQIVDWTIYPATTDALRSDVDLSLYELEVDMSEEAAQLAIEKWLAADYVKMVIKEVRRGGQDMVRMEVNGKDYVDDMWLVREGHRLLIRMMLRGKANPYLVYAAMFGKNSWIEAAEYPAYRVEAFVETDASQVDFFRPSCDECGQTIPVNLLDKPYHHMYCPRHLDEVEQRLVRVG